MSSFTDKWRKMWAKRSGLFPMSADEQLDYVNGLREPENDFERSIMQYKCQMALCKKRTVFLLNLAAAVVLPFHALAARIASLFKRVGSEPVSAVYLKDLPLTYVQDSVKRKHPDLIQVSPGAGRYYGKNEARFVRGLIRKCRYPYLVYKTFVKLLSYGWTVKKYAPERIIVSNEFSFTSSALTAYCEGLGVSHTDVMHGEKILNMRDSFFRFTECYVWHEHYRTLFLKLRAFPDQFVIEMPEALRMDVGAAEDKTVDYTYYLGAETERELSVIRDVLDRLKDAGSSVAVRPHPRYSDAVSVKKLFEGFTVEDGSLPVNESVKRTAFPISKYSTVLLQAALNGNPIVIDDISDPELIANLKSADYIGFEIEHRLLSELIRNYSEKEQ